jgi:hypothetical protein
MRRPGSPLGLIRDLTECQVIGPHRKHSPLGQIRGLFNRLRLIGGGGGGPFSSAAWVPFPVLSDVLGAAICRSTPLYAGRLSVSY